MGDDPHANSQAPTTEEPDHPFGFYSRSLKDSVWDAAPRPPDHIGRHLAEKWSTMTAHTETDQEPED